MGEWRRVRIGDFLHRAKSPVSLRDDEEYQLVTVRMHHNGVTLREKKKGKLIGSNMYRVKAGQFILSGIDARHGAFGVIPAELDGAIVTNDFWYFDVDDAVVSRDFFLWFTSTPLFLDACIKSSEGTTNRRRLQAEKFFNFSFNFPGIKEQHRLAERFITFDKTHSALKDEFEIQTTHFKQLRQAVLQEAVEGKLTADWRRQHPMVKGDPQHDAAALLAQIKAEKERLIKAGKIRKEKPLPPIADIDKPFGLPAGWGWCKIDELVRSLKDDIRTGPFGTSLQKHEHKNAGIPVWGIESINKKGTFTGINKIFVTAEKATELKSFAVTAKDIIISRSGTVGELCCLPDDVIYGLISTNLMKISLNRTVVSPDYFCLLFKGTKSIDVQLEALCFGTTRLFLTQSILTQLLFPLPPLAEQQAIVARVDSLMATIDALEAQVTERKEQAQQLMQAVLREAFADGDALEQQL
jgi:type I restriction enzyme S subunit